MSERSLSRARLLETREGWLLIKSWTTVKGCRPADDATLSHSLRFAGEKGLTSKAVANNIIKPAEVDHVEKLSNCNVEGTRSMEAS